MLIERGNQHTINLLDFSRICIGTISSSALTASLYILCFTSSGSESSALFWGVSIRDMGTTTAAVDSAWLVCYIVLVSYEHSAQHEEEDSLPGQQPCCCQGWRRSSLPWWLCVVLWYNVKLKDVKRKGCSAESGSQ